MIIISIAKKKKLWPLYLYPEPKLFVQIFDVDDDDELGSSSFGQNHLS